MRRSDLFEIASLIALGAMSRLVPHLPNLTTIGAIALKSRARFGSAGLLIPHAAMLLSDAIIGFYNWKLLVSVYASFTLIGALGVFLKRPSTSRTISIAASGSILFFLMTNTTVWATSTWYPHTAAGLLACLVAGLPFLYPMLAGDIVFSVLLFRFKPVHLLASGVVFDHSYQAVLSPFRNSALRNKFEKPATVLSASMLQFAHKKHNVDL